MGGWHGKNREVLCIVLPSSSLKGLGSDNTGTFVSQHTGKSVCDYTELILQPSLNAKLAKRCACLHAICFVCCRLIVYHYVHTQFSGSVSEMQTQLLLLLKVQPFDKVMRKLSWSAEHLLFQLQQTISIASLFLTYLPSDPSQCPYQTVYLHCFNINPLLFFFPGL